MVFYESDFNGNQDLELKEDEVAVILMEKITMVNSFGNGNKILYLADIMKKESNDVEIISVGVQIFDKQHPNLILFTLENKIFTGFKYGNYACVNKIKEYLDPSSVMKLGKHILDIVEKHNNVFPTRHLSIFLGLGANLQSNELLEIAKEISKDSAIITSGKAYTYKALVCRALEESLLVIESQKYKWIKSEILLMRNILNVLLFIGTDEESAYKAQLKELINSFN